jgi:hypothetical protein
LAEFSDTTVRRVDQLEALTGVAVISRIPPLDPINSPSFGELT